MEYGKEVGKDTVQPAWFPALVSSSPRGCQSIRVATPSVLRIVPVKEVSWEDLNRAFRSG